LSNDVSTAAFSFSLKIMYSIYMETSLTVIVVTASVKEDERGGQGHTSTSLFASACHMTPHCEHTLFL
jgi:hypothetical protein